MYKTIANLGKADKRRVLLQHDPDAIMPWRLDVNGNGKYFSEYEQAMAWVTIERYNAKHWKNKLPEVRNSRTQP